MRVWEDGETAFAALAGRRACCAEARRPSESRDATRQAVGPIRIEAIVPAARVKPEFSADHPHPPPSDEHHQGIRPKGCHLIAEATATWLADPSAWSPRDRCLSGGNARSSDCVKPPALAL